MRNETSRISRGIAQRALALLLSLTLLAGFFPASALAEISNESGTTTEQSNGTNGQSNSTYDADSPSADSLNKAVDASLPNTDKPSSTGTNQQAETVSATLKISVYGATLVNHAFDIASGSTVEDLLNLAKTQGYIDDYSHGEPFPGYTGYYVSTVIVNNTTYAPLYENGISHYWAAYKSGIEDWDGINQTSIKADGFSYELNFTTWPDGNGSFDNGTNNYPTNPDAAHPDSTTKNDTTSFANESGKTSTTTSAATSNENAELAWKKKAEGFYPNISEILTIGNTIYFASGDWGSTATLYCLDAKTGAEKGSLLLFGAIDSTCRPVYSDGIIVIPLSGGRLQGIAADNLTSLWVSAAMDDAKTYKNIQNVSSLTVFNNTVYTGIASSLDDNWLANRGAFFGLDIKTGALKWKNQEATSGYYWSGACVVNDTLLYGNDAGVLYSVNPETGKIISTLSLGASIRSTVTTDGAGNAFVSTNNGSLHKIVVDSAGNLTKQATTNFNGTNNCTSSATYYQGKLFIGGASNTGGVLAVIDAASMKVERLITAPFEIKSTPLVATAEDGSTYIYFTCNGAEGNYPNYTSGGEAWVYKLGDTSASKLIQIDKEDANWCTKSLSLSSDGTLFWSNDSGTIFALKKTSSNNNTPATPSAPSSPSTEPTTPSALQNTIAVSQNQTGAPTAQTPLVEAKKEASSEDDAAVEATSFHGETARSASSDSASDSFAWAPYVGIAIGIVGLAGVGVVIFRRLRR